MYNGNNPAYPLSGKEYQKELGRGVGMEEYKGLTKREIFAMAAMQGLLSNPKIGDEYSFNEVESIAIRKADKLLKQLES